MKIDRLSSLILIAITGCQMPPNAATVTAQKEQTARDLPREEDKQARWNNFMADVHEDTRKYELTVAAVHTVRVGDTHQQFEAKILPARQSLLIFDGDSSTSTIRVERYHIMPRDRGATFTVYFQDNRVTDYLIVGF